MAKKTKTALEADFETLVEDKVKAAIALLREATREADANEVSISGLDCASDLVSAVKDTGLDDYDFGWYNSNC